MITPTAAAIGTQSDNMRKLHLSPPCVLAVAGALSFAPHALAHRHPGHGGVSEAEGRYSAVFTLEDALPNRRITPGAINPAVEQANIRETICVRGFSKSIRPPEEYTERLKRLGVRRYGYGDHRLRDYEEDHLVSLELGGSPNNPRNLWPEPHHVIGGWGSYTKDRLENRLHTLVCRGRVPLAQAQHDIASDWIAAYKRYVGPDPAASRGHHRVD